MIMLTLSICFPIASCPSSGVKTEQGTAAAEFFGMLEYAITVDESVDALVPKV
jgi:hypothetical protein